MLHIKKENIEFPCDVVYKYRNWSDGNHRRFIIEREVYKASADSFTDKNDCSNQERFDFLTPEQIYQYYLSDSKNKNSSFNLQQHENLAKNWAEKLPLNNKEDTKRLMVQFQKEYFEREGILSLTANSENDIMLNEYADSGKRFCIGYNIKELYDYLGGCGAVKYVEELPLILPEPFMKLEEILIKKVYFKLNKFSFEEEYRTKKFWNNSASLEERRIILPANVFKEIILGHNMSSKK